MRMFRFATLPLLACAALIHAERSSASGLMAKLDSLVSKVQATGEMAGLSVAVVEHGKLTISKQYGYACIEKKQPVTSTSLFPIGSVSKQFTAACVMLLVEDGKLSLDDPVSRFLPYLTSADKISVRDLLNHTSGYHDWYPLDYLDSRLAKDTDTDTVARTYAGTFLDYDPGKYYSYSNTGYLVAAMIVEKVSGEPLFHFLKRRILDPLRMTHTVEYAPKSRDEVCRYTSWMGGPPEVAVPEAKGWMLGAATLMSTPEDLAKWDIALMSGRVLKPSSWKEMIMPRLLTTGIVSHYGFGEDSFIFRKHQLIEHGGGVSGSETENLLDPQDQDAIILTWNLDNGGYEQFVGPILTDLVSGQDEAPHPPAPSPAPPVKVEGPGPAAVASSLFQQIQDNKLDRSKLTDACNEFFSAEKLKKEHDRLVALGKPKVKLQGMSERGGMQVAVLKFVFPKTTIQALLYRHPDGMVDEFMFTS